MHPSVPDALRFPAPPEGWTYASDEVLAAFVGQTAAWRDRVVEALADGRALAGLVTERGREVFTAALRRERPVTDPEPRRVGLPLFPAANDAVRVAFDDIMEWRDRVVNNLVLDHDLVSPSHDPGDAFVMRTCLHPAGPEERCDVCVLRNSDEHRCPMSPWCDPPPYAGRVRPFPDRLRFPAPPKGPWASERALGAFVEAVLAWRRRVVAALGEPRNALPDTLTELAASYLLSALSPDLPLVSSWTPRFPAHVPTDGRGFQTLLKWRDSFVSSLSNARSEGDNKRILTSREERVLRQFMRPPDGDPRCPLCLAPCSRAGEQWTYCCATRHWQASSGAATGGAGASGSTDADPSMSATPAIAAVIGGALLCVAVIAPGAALQALFAALGALAIAGGIFVYVR